MSTARADTVAVIIAAHNAQATIGRAIRSALAQERVAEVMVVDDASTDATPQVAAAQDDGSGRLKVLALPTNKGPAAARNLALDQTSAPLVCVLDSDDYFLERRVERLLSSGDDDWDLLADDIVIVPEALGRARLSLARPSAKGKPCLVGLAQFVEGNITVAGRPRGEMAFVKPLMKRAFLQRHGLRYDEQLRLGEDYALYVSALLQGARLRLVGACGYIAIERGTSLSSHHATRSHRQLADFDTACLTAHPGLPAADKRALRRHRRATLNKHLHRVVLDCKQERGRLAALARLAMSPQAVPYIAAETWRAKRARLQQSLGRAGDAGTAPGTTPGIRLLLGLAPDELVIAPEPARADG